MAVINVNAILVGGSDQFFAAVVDSQEALSAQATLAGTSQVVFQAKVKSSIAMGVVGESSLLETLQLHLDGGSGTSIIPTVKVTISATLQASSGAGFNANLTSLETTLAGDSAVQATAQVVHLTGLASQMGGSAGFSSTPRVHLAASLTMSAGSTLTAEVHTAGAYGGDGYGTSPFGGLAPLYGIELAMALSATEVRVRYTDLFDPTYPPLLDPSNYAITGDTLTAVISVALETAQSVVLTTSPLLSLPYTVTILAAKGLHGQPLDPGLDSADFEGAAASPNFYAVGTRKDRVRVVFSIPMQANAALSSPASYSLTAMGGGVLTIASVSLEQVSNIRSVVLKLDPDTTMDDEGHYKVVIVGNVRDAAHSQVPDPLHALFQWNARPLVAQIPLSYFSGFGDIPGIPPSVVSWVQSQVFFSPALQTPVGNSIMQVDEVDVCTRASDVYEIPPQVETTTVLHTHGAGVVPTLYDTVLNRDVLWADFGIVKEASFGLGVERAETFLPPEDYCTVTLTQQSDSRVSLLNNPTWRTFDGQPEVPTTAPSPSLYFRTFDVYSSFTPVTTTTVLDLGSGT